MHYYIENTKTELAKFLSLRDYTTLEWLEIYDFYNNHSDYIIVKIQE